MRTKKESEGEKKNLGRDTLEELDTEEIDQTESRIPKLIVLFIVGFLIGISLKSQAVETVTMGYEDFRLKQYNFSNQAQEIDLEQKSQEGNSEEEINIDNK